MAKSVSAKAYKEYSESDFSDLVEKLMPFFGIGLDEEEMTFLLVPKKRLVFRDEEEMERLKLRLQHELKATKVSNIKLKFNKHWEYTLFPFPMKESPMNT